MAAPRHTSIRALRQLSQHSRQQSTRNLHILPHLPPRPNAPKAITNAQHPFTTSQRRQSPHGASTVDAVYLPMSALAEPDSINSRIRVPLVPTNYAPRRTGINAIEPESGFLAATATAAAIARGTLAGEDEHNQPTIQTAAGDGTHWGAPSAMSDADHHHGEIDFTEVAKGLARVVDTVEDKVVQESSVVRQLWRDAMEDIFGPAHKPGAGAV